MKVFIFISITLLIAMSVFFFMKTKNVSLKKKKMIENQKQYATATEVMNSILSDPLVVDRIDFNENLNGSIGDFTGYSSVSENNWLHGFPHEKA